MPEDEKGRATGLKESIAIAKKWFYGAADRGGGRGQRREKQCSAKEHIAHLGEQ